MHIACSAVAHAHAKKTPVRVLMVNCIPSWTFRDTNNNNKADSLLRLNINVNIDVDNRERARAKGKKQGDRFRWNKNITILYITMVRKKGES